jgi:hypothetical protein
MGRIVVIEDFLKDSSARAVADHLLSVPQVRVFPLKDESVLAYTHSIRACEGFSSRDG